MSSSTDTYTKDSYRTIFTGLLSSLVPEAQAALVLSTLGATSSVISSLRNNTDTGFAGGIQFKESALNDFLNPEVFSSYRQQRDNILFLPSVIKGIDGDVRNSDSVTRIC